MITVLGAPTAHFRRSTPHGGQDYDREDGQAKSDGCATSVDPSMTRWPSQKTSPIRASSGRVPWRRGVQVRRTYREESEPGFLAQDLDLLRGHRRPHP